MTKVAGQWLFCEEDSFILMHTYWYSHVVLINIVCWVETYPELAVECICVSSELEKIMEKVYYTKI